MGVGTQAGAVWAAVLSPAVGVLPALAARIGGQGGWLAPLAALSVLLLLTKAWGALAHKEALPTGLTIIYIMWALLLGGARLRLSGQRLQYTAQREANLWFFLLVLAGGAAWLAWGKREAFLRGAAVFGRVLTPALAGVVAFTLFQVRAENLFPLWTEDLLALIKASVPVLGVLCYGVYGAFVWTGETRGVRSRIGGGCLLLSALILTVLGNLGAELAGALEDPFLTLSKHVGVKGAFQRVESLVSALWLLGDLSLLGLLLWACRRLLPAQKGTRVAMGGAAAMLLLAGTLFRTAVWAQWFEYTVAPLGNLVLGGAVPCALYLHRRRKGISCAPKARGKADIGTEEKD